MGCSTSARLQKLSSGASLWPEQLQGDLAAEGGCRSTLHACPCLLQHLPKGNFRGFCKEQPGINRLELIAAVTETAQSWQGSRLLSLAPTLLKKGQIN